MNKLTSPRLFDYIFYLSFIFVFSGTMFLCAQPSSSEKRPIRKPITQRPKFSDKYSPLDKPKAVKILTDELIWNTIENAKQSYIKALILLQKQDTSEAIIQLESSLTNLNKLTSYPEIDTNAEYVDLVTTVMTDYNNVARNKEMTELLIPPLERFFQTDSISPLIGDTTGLALTDSLSKDFAKPPSADTSENYIFSIPHIDDLQIPLSEHQAVEEQINLLTVGRVKSYPPIWLERSSRWFPLMKKIAERENMPHELLVLTFIESSLRPDAESKKKATGLWQFLYATGIDYGLNKRQSIWVDERRDPMKSTRAALRYLKDLYLEFSDWYLALNAYNWGWGNVRRALKLCNKENPTYWDIRNQKNINMPKEAREYVPLFLAVLKITSDPAKYGIDVTKLNYEPEFKFDIIEIEQPSNLEAIAQAIGVGISEIRELNPELLYDVTPPDRRFYRLRVPIGSNKDFEKKFAVLPDKIKQPSLEYIVKKGETVVSIAEKFDVSIDNFLSLNSLAKNNIVLPANEKIRIPIGGNNFAQSNLIAANNQLVAKVDALKENDNFHITTAKESIYSIAQKYNINPADIRNWNDISIEQDTIEEGKTIIISAKEAEMQNKNTNANSVDLLNNTDVSHPTIATNTKSNSNSNQYKTITHRVVSGESLHKIANKYDVSINTIKELNPSIKNDLIRINDILIIPSKENINNSGQSSNVATSNDSTKTKSNKQAISQYHTVRSGDNLTLIAKKYKTNINKIISLNKRLKPDVLSIGQKIRVK